MKRRTFLGSVAGAGATVAAGALAGCVGSGLSTDQYDVGMAANAFEPAEITVTTGETVVWGNSSSRPHSVTAYENGIPEGADYFASGGFESQRTAEDGYFDDRGVVDPGETYEHAFEVPGTYRYFCIPHEPAGMKGAVVVEE